MTLRRSLIWSPGFFAIGLVLFQLRPVAGQLGHDYSHYFARILIGADYFWKNGFSTPHFTPYLCGGMPFYADPQAVYHSVQQFLTFWIPPLLALRITLGVFYLIGFWGMITLASRVFRFSDWIAALLGLLFVLNGFCYFHILVGHTTHYQFLLAPWLLYSIGKPTEGNLRKEMGAAAIQVLVLSYTLFSGGLHILVVFAAMQLLFLPTVFRLRSEKREYYSFLRTVGFSIIGFLCICSSKLLAVKLFSPIFVKAGVDSSTLPILTLVRQYFWLNVAHIPPYLRFGRWDFGPWEYIGFVSKPALILAVIGLLFTRFWTRTGIITVAISLFIILLATGNAANEKLPFFNGYHNPLKILAAFVPLILLLAGTALQKFEKMNWVKERSLGWGRAVFCLLVFFSFSEFLVYTSIFRMHPGVLGTLSPDGIYGMFKNAGGLPAVSTVVFETNRDLTMAFQGKTSLGCYEPLFGYRHETFATHLALGSVFGSGEGSYNLHAPACFLYGKQLGCEPFANIRRSDAKNFELFRAGYQTEGWVPWWQTFFDRLSLWSVFLMIILLCYSLFPERLYFNQKLREIPNG